MDAHPTVVLNDALVGAKTFLEQAGSAMCNQLVEQLANEPHYAEFEIRVRGRIVNPQTGATVAEIDLPQRYEVFWDRNPDSADRTE